LRNGLKNIKGKIRGLNVRDNRYKDIQRFKVKYGDVPEEPGDRPSAALLYHGATNQKIPGVEMEKGIKRRTLYAERRKWNNMEQIPGWVERIFTPKVNELIGEVKALNTKVDGLRNEMLARFEAADVKIDSLRNETKADIESLRKDDDFKVRGGAFKV